LFAYEPLFSPLLAVAVLPASGPIGGFLGCKPEWPRTFWFKLIAAEFVLAGLLPVALAGT